MIFFEFDCVKKELFFKYIEDGMVLDNDELVIVIVIGFVEVIVILIDVN